MFIDAGEGLSSITTRGNNNGTLEGKCNIWSKVNMKSMHRIMLKIYILITPGKRKSGVSFKNEKLRAFAKKLKN